MFKPLLSLLAAKFTILALLSSAQAETLGSPDEARAMIDAAVVALAEDHDAAIEAFNTRAEGFFDRDLYVFCFEDRLEGVITAHGGAPERMLGMQNAAINDKEGNNIPNLMIPFAEAGQVKEAVYMWPRPGEETPIEKHSFYTKSGDEICGVGYYKN